MAFEEWDVPMPDAEPLMVEGVSLPYVWRSHLVCVTTDQLSDAVQSRIEALGYALATLPKAPGTEPPDELLSLMGIAR